MGIKRNHQLMTGVTTNTDSDVVYLQGNGEQVIFQSAITGGSVTVTAKGRLDPNMPWKALGTMASTGDTVETAGYPQVMVTTSSISGATVNVAVRG